MDASGGTVEASLRDLWEEHNLLTYPNDANVCLGILSALTTMQSTYILKGIVQSYDQCYTNYNMESPLA